MTVLEIPLKAQPQTFLITLADAQYRLTVKWCDASSAWTFDLDTAQGTHILAGIPLVTGRDLLEAFAYLNLGGALWASTDHDPATPPTFENLGAQGHLYFATP